MFYPVSKHKTLRHLSCTGYRQVQQCGVSWRCNTVQTINIWTTQTDKTAAAAAQFAVFGFLALSLFVRLSLFLSLSLSVCAWQLLLLFSRCFHSQLERKKRSKKQTTQKLRLCHEFFGVCLVSPPRCPFFVFTFWICLPIYIDNNKYVKHSRSHVCLKLSSSLIFLFFC